MLPRTSSLVVTCEIHPGMGRKLPVGFRVRGSRFTVHGSQFAIYGGPAGRRFRARWDRWDKMGLMESGSVTTPRGTNHERRTENGEPSRAVFFVDRALPGRFEESGLPHQSS
jgi:hypothetical protein